MNMNQLGNRVTWIVAPLCLFVSPISIGLGVWKSKPEWVACGVALIVYAVVAIRQARRQTTEAISLAPRPTEENPA